MRYRRPEEFKETDVHWIGEVPNNWSLKRLKFISKVNSSNVDKKSKEYEIAVELCNYTDVYYNEFITEQLEFMKATASDSNIKRFQLQEGDVIITKDSESPDDMAVPALVKETKENLLCGYHLALITSNEDIACGDYLFRLFQSKKYREEFGNRSNGITRYGLGVHEIKNISIHIPPLPEQRAIATFLDRKTEAIDGLIQKKEQLIERHTEKRQALITRAVTKGLDPEAPMKDSGIKWLGEIPEAWEVKNLKFLAKVNSSNVDKKSKEDEEQVELCNYTDVYYNEFITKKLEFMKATASDSKIKQYQLDVDNVIITKDSEDPNDIAVPALVQETKEKLLCGYHLALIKCEKDILGEYLFRLFQSKKYREEFGNRCNGITRYGLGVHEMKNIEIILPSIEKQREIIDSLNQKINQIDNVIEATQESIPKIKEYRQSLISAAVTGKLDVRDEIEDEKQKTQTANIYFRRRVLAAKILDELYTEPTMGRRKLQKILYLLEMEIEGLKLKSKYQKDAAGPFDNQMMRSIESQLLENNWFKRVKRENGYGYKYLPMAEKDKYKEYYPRYWGEFSTEIDDYLDLFSKQKTHLLSLVATLYACWNDFIIRDEKFDGKKLIHEARYNWHEEKKEIPYKDWKKALKWMWNNDLKPQGTGELTKEKN